MSGDRPSSETNSSSNAAPQEQTRVNTDPATNSQTAPHKLADSSEVKPASAKGQSTSEPVDDPE